MPRTAIRPDAIAALLLLGLATGGCGPERVSDDPPDETAQATPVPIESADCLVLAWEGQDAPDRDFDRANDRAEGGAISCATGTTASQFEAALAAIREAATSGDKARLLEQLGIPLLYIDAKGRRRQLTDPTAIDAVFDELFPPQTVALLQRVDLADLTVVAGEGAFLELGAIWLVVDKAGGRPRIATVNAQALGEAAEAAKRAAEEGRTTPAPIAN